MKNKLSSGAFTMGIVLLLTVLLVLMLTTFSLLTLSTARADLMQAQALAQRTDSYYAANNQAERVLAQLAQGQEPELPVLRQDGQISFSVPLGQTQQLTVVLTQDLTVITWQVETAR